jgi:cytoskeletal protein CcmA (bactofilin family)
MFNAKNKTDNMPMTNGNGAGTTLIGAGTTLKGDIQSQSDLRIDGVLIGNIQTAAKIVVGSQGVVEGDIQGLQADIVGKVNGNIRVRELLQLRGEAVVTGNIYAGKLQVEPSATFNGQCHMGANIVEMNGHEQVPAVTR